MNKVFLISFADKRFRNSLSRLKDSTNSFPFDKRYFLTQETALSRDYWKSLKPWLYRRGYGYWAWKAVIIKEFMDSLDNGDMIFWSDGGIYWNDAPKAIARFEEYTGMINEENPLLTFQQPTIEQEYTKGDVLDALGVYNNKEVCESLQLWAGCFLIMKTPEIVNFMERWIDLNDLSKELITDKRSKIPNKPEYKEHRHDQSIFSLLAKQIPHIEIPWTEVLPKDDNWESLSSSPIQGRRLKELDRPKSEVIKNKLTRPWRTFLHFYFKKVRNYEYLANNYPW